MNFPQKMQGNNNSGLGFKEYVDALEAERRKIQVFHRELPLCLELVTQAIESCRQQLSGTTTSEYMNGGQSECSEQTSSPVLEEFMPIKRAATAATDHSLDFDDKDEQSDDRNNNTNSNDGMKNKLVGQADWLRSAQLWNQTPDPPIKEDEPKKASVVEVKRNGGAFQPFHREKASLVKTRPAVSTPQAPAAASSTAGTTASGGGGRGGATCLRIEKESQNNRKQRRCWSPELHRRFLHALQQLGRSHAATPKQIRELMKVDGLTNDEVKSHLQKYRLHTRRPSSAGHNNGSPRAPQFVVVGGIWVPPPPEYTGGAAATTRSPPTIYSSQQMVSVSQDSAAATRRPSNVSSDNLGEVGGGGGSGFHSNNSPTTSSSSHTSTGSPVL